MPRLAPRPQLLRRAALRTVAAMAGGILAACGPGPGTVATTAPRAAAPRGFVPKAVVTTKVAAAILDRYVEINNEANKRRDAILLSTVEAGQLAEQSKVNYEQWRTWSTKDQKAYRSPFYYQQAKYYLPATGTATWFAVRATVGTGPHDEALLIFDKIDGTYKMVFALSPEFTPIPEIAVDRHGLATAVAPTVRVGPLAPDEVSTASEDLFATGGKRSGAELAQTPATSEAAELYKERNHNDKGVATTELACAAPAHPAVYALRLANGGVLAVVPTAHTSTRAIKPAYRTSYQIEPSAAEAIYNSASRDSIVDEQQGEALAILNASGKPMVIGLEYRIVDSR